MKRHKPVLQDHESVCVILEIDAQMQNAVSKVIVTIDLRHILHATNLKLTHRGNMRVGDSIEPRKPGLMKGSSTFPFGR
jgi:hypothetical protein